MPHSIAVFQDVLTAGGPVGAGNAGVWGAGDIFDGDVEKVAGEGIVRRVAVHPGVRMDVPRADDATEHPV